MFLQSGTAAIAAGLQAAIRDTKAPAPEVVVPAYSSPDIIKAIRFVGAKPVPVDFEANRPWLDPQQLEDKITSRTVAVVAVRFLGLPERVDTIREALGDRAIRIIYDCCHSRPGGSTCDTGDADYVVFSFGRGKQVSFLGGGVLVRNTDRGLPPLEGPGPAPRRPGRAMAHRLKIEAHNVLLRPPLFGMLDHFAVPGVRGRPARPLSHIGPMPEHIVRIVGSLPDREFGFGPRAPDIARLLTEMPDDELVDLPTLCGHDSAHGLIRYPVLLRSREVRDACLEDLVGRGLGASRLYSGLLPDLTGVSLAQDERGRLRNAQSFCDRLLTLPVHSFVTARHVREIGSLLQQHVGAGEALLI